MKKNIIEQDSIQKPLILNPKNRSDARQLSALFRNKSTHIIDEFLKQKEELCLIKNPKLLKEGKKPTRTVSAREGRWIYFPWRNSLVYCLSVNEYRLVRTSRNNNLITKSEQKKFENAVIGIAGLNVGNPVAICLALESGSRKLMKLADNDFLSLSNFNRFRAGLPDLGKNKAVLTAEQIWEIDPYARLEILPKGIEPHMIEKFFLKPRIDILVEEMDNLPLKIAMREYAKKYKIPVLMVTGNGAGLIIDIERYDLNPKLLILNGMLDKKVLRKIKCGVISFAEKVELSRDFMKAKNLVPRLRQSFRLIGNSLAGIPQIAEASFLRGAVVCNLARRIIVGDRVKSGRYFIDLNVMSG
ncbi:MAG: ThiF family adenylyltransferase [Patescibacteria group bacterium]